MRLDISGNIRKLVYVKEIFWSIRFIPQKTRKCTNVEAGL